MFSNPLVITFKYLDIIFFERNFVSRIIILITLFLTEKNIAKRPFTMTTEPPKKDEAAAPPVVTAETLIHVC